MKIKFTIAILHILAAVALSPQARSQSTSTNPIYDFKEGSVCYVYNERFEDPVSLEVVTNSSYKGLKTIEIPESLSIENISASGDPRIGVVEYIADDTFRDRIGLTSVQLPSSLKRIGKSAFRNTGIAEINLPDAVYFIDDDAFADNSRLTKITLPESLIILGRRAFENCPKLQEVTLPSTLKQLGGFTFLCSTGLRKVYCHAVEPPVANDTDFGVIACNDRIEDILDCEDTRMYTGPIPFEVSVLYVPEESIEKYRNAPGWKNFVNIKAFGEDFVTDIDLVLNPDDVKISVLDGGILRVDAPEGYFFRICTLEGLEIERCRIDEIGFKEFNLASGIYIVVGYNGTFEKIMIP